MEYVCFAIAGLLVGGVIATRQPQKKKPIWMTVILGLLGALFLWMGMRASTR